MVEKRTFGLGLRHPHHEYVVQNNPKVDFFEIHAENFVCEGGASLDFLKKISNLYPLSFHCVGMSLGSASGLDKKHLKNLKKLVDQFKPILLSDHLSWSDSSKSGTANDLLPVPYTKEALNIFCDNVKQAQDFFGREILVENPSAYLEFEESEFTEVDFMNEIAEKTKCGILLDINNVFVGASNFVFDAAEYLSKIDASKVKEIHMAGHSIFEYNGKKVRIDTHSDHACDEVMDLFKNFVKRTDIKVPILFEWDEKIPQFDVLYDEMKRVQNIL